MLFVGCVKDKEKYTRYKMFPSDRALLSLLSLGALFSEYIHLSMEGKKERGYILQISCPSVDSQLTEGEEALLYIQAPKTPISSP